jgi:hypothetical protein
MYYINLYKLLDLPTYEVYFITAVVHGIQPGTISGPVLLLELFGCYGISRVKKLSNMPIPLEIAMNQPLLSGLYSFRRKGRETCVTCIIKLC